MDIYGRLLMKAAEAARKAQYELDTKWLIKGDVDEVSILFKHEAELEGFVQFCRTHSVEHFNSVPRDHAHPTSMSDWGFDVRFEFLRIPGATFRIEAMCVLEGNAPLHAACRNHEIVHASFKCADLAHYLHTMSVMGHLLPLQHEYQNSYGRFGYFGTYAPYFKPRINLRDRQKATNS